MPERTRLHISPLTPELLAALLPLSVLPTASGISYHTLQTFPDRNYGYVELPAMEAEKIKKKLNGSILKGHKMRVEAARPDKKTKRSREGDAVDSVEEEHAVKKARKLRIKQKTRDGVLPGYELPENRKVKRGWTEPKADKNSKLKKETKEKRPKAKASTLTGKPECLFRTIVPPNGTKNPDVATKGDPTAKAKKKGKSSREVVVHEFSNTAKHANFLRDSQVTKGEKAVAEYVDGKGWVDKNGDIVERERTTRRPRPDPSKSTGSMDMDEISSSEDDSDNLERDSSPEHQLPKLVISSPRHEAVDETTSSGTSSESEVDEAVPVAYGSAITNAEASDDSSVDSLESEEAAEEKFGIHIAGSRSPSRSASSMSSDKEADAATKANDAITDPEHETREVHPLESIFKRPECTASNTPRKPSLAVRTSFSFFDPDVADEGSSLLTIPQTPFTQRDIQERTLRSAAPTPDTAAPGKTFANMWAGDPDIEDGGEDEHSEGTAEHDLNSTPLAEKSNATKEGEREKRPESDFAKWFWEHRGETNRAWKKRRREAAKEQRQRENRKRGRTAI
ncbi:hypothetical protein MMC08_005286 [Hypocenomyce scalaris]|nr:hypothetical protein [Hypocenomyce scalaris]